MANLASQQYKKSLLNTYSISSQAVATGDTLLFNNTNIDSGCSIDFSAGTGEITLTGPGAYLIIADASISATGAGLVTMQINRGGSAVNGARSSVTVEAGSNYSSSVSTIINVLPSCRMINNATTITVVNSGIATTYTNINLTVIKLC